MPINNQPCEVPECDKRAIMCLYAKNPGTKMPEPKRNDNPFYPIEEAHFTMNLCTECFWEMSAQMREAQYVGMRATGYLRRSQP